jgi:hypothetical protein
VEELDGKIRGRIDVLLPTWEVTVLHILIQILCLSVHLIICRIAIFFKYIVMCDRCSN